MPNQADRILALLRERPAGITAIDALNEVGSFRLAARIADLREAGHVITTETIERGGKRFARYRLIEEPQAIVLWPKEVQ